MGAVAAALRERGFTVTGSDENVYPPMSTFLESRGIALHAGYRPENIPADAEIVVIGNAMKRGNPEVEADRKSTRLNSSHGYISYAVFCLKKKKKKKKQKK